MKMKVMVVAVGLITCLLLPDNLRAAVLTRVRVDLQTPKDDNSLWIWSPSAGYITPIGSVTGADDGEIFSTSNPQLLGDLTNGINDIVAFGLGDDYRYLTEQQLLMTRNMFVPLIAANFPSLNGLDFAGYSLHDVSVQVWSYDLYANTIHTTVVYSFNGEAAAVPETCSSLLLLSATPLFLHRRRHPVLD